jgi:HSP20 family molecular chaperone IbpA
MTTDLTSKPQSAKHPVVLKLIGGSPFSQRMQQVYNIVAHRAYELYESGGRQDSHDVEDWLRAEAELVNTLPVEVSETEDQVVVRAKSPGLSANDSANDFEVRVAPHRLIITGKREQIHDDKATHIDRSSDEILRILDLSQAIDPDEVTATVKDGRLEIQLPKARPDKNITDATQAA